MHTCSLFQRGSIFIIDLLDIIKAIDVHGWDHKVFILFQQFNIIGIAVDDASMKEPEQGIKNHRGGDGLAGVMLACEHYAWFIIIMLLSFQFNSLLKEGIKLFFG